MLKFAHLTLDVMAGHSRPKDGVATLAYDPAIHEAPPRVQPYVRFSFDEPLHEWPEQVRP